MIRVGVVGAGGRMGREVARAVVADPEMDLVAAIDPKAAGDAVEGVTVMDRLSAAARCRRRGRGRLHRSRRRDAYPPLDGG